MNINFNMETKTQSFTDTFFNKLKEQSFTIIILVGIMYYQNLLFNKQMDEYKEAIDKKEELIKGNKKGEKSVQNYFLTSPFSLS